MMLPARFAAYAPRELLTTGTVKYTCDQLEAGETSWVMSPDGKLLVGLGQRDLNEYLLLEAPIVEVGGGPNNLAQPDSFGVHLHLRVQQRGKESSRQR